MRWSNLNCSHQQFGVALKIMHITFGACSAHVHDHRVLALGPWLTMASPSPCELAHVPLSLAVDRSYGMSSACTEPLHHA
jgi:hypothetical protein